MREMFPFRCCGGMLHFQRWTLIISWKRSAATLGCLSYLPDQCTSQAQCLGQLVNVQRCADGLHGFVAGWFYNLSYSSIDQEKKKELLKVCMFVYVCVCVVGRVELALSFSLIGARTRPSGPPVLSLSLDVCAGIGAVSSACHCSDMQGIIAKACTRTEWLDITLIATSFSCICWLAASRCWDAFRYITGVNPQLWDTDLLKWSQLYDSKKLSFCRKKKSTKVPYKTILHLVLMIYLVPFLVFKVITRFSLWNFTKIWISCCLVPHRSHSSFSVSRGAVQNEWAL